jgi:hypothetical protein
VEWCKVVGTKLLDTSIDPDTVLSGTLETKIVKERPEGMPVAVDWPDEIYTSAETPWSISIDGTVVHISELALELVDPTLLGPIRFAVVSETAQAEFELEIFPLAETSDFKFVKRGDKPVRIIRAETEIDAAERDGVDAVGTLPGATGSLGSGGGCGSVRYTDHRTQADGPAEAAAGSVSH